MFPEMAITRHVIIILPFLISGCGPSYDWRDEHRGILKSVSGYSTMMVLEFDGGIAYQVSGLSESDPWKIGEECILQSRKSSGCSIEWRFRSPKFQPEPHPPAEKEKVSQ